MRGNHIIVGLFVLAALFGATPVFATTPPNISQTVGVCDPNFPQRCVKPNTDGSVNISGTISASAAAFTPTSATSNTSLAVTSTTASVALPVGLTQVVQNTGSQTAFVTFSTGAGTATTAGFPVQAGGQVAFAVNGPTFLNAITATGTANLLISGGAGVPALAISGGGSSFSGVVTNAGTFAVQNTAATPTGSNVIGALTANQSINESQINGVTPLMGNGTSGTGAQRVTIASDNTAFTINAAQSGTWNLNNITGTVTLPTGASTAAKQATLDSDGAPIVPQAGTATRTLTATNLALNTNQTICPAATNPVATEIYFTTAGVGVGLNGQTLTTAAPTTTTTSSPDIVINTAGTLYTAPVGANNAITAYGAAGLVRCIQTLRR